MKKHEKMKVALVNKEEKKNRKHKNINMFIHGKFMRFIFFLFTLQFYVFTFSYIFLVGLYK